MIASATGFARDEGFCVSCFKLNMLHHNSINVNSHVKIFLSHGHKPYHKVMILIEMMIVPAGLYKMVMIL